MFDGFYMLQKRMAQFGGHLTKFSVSGDKVVILENLSFHLETWIVLVLDSLERAQDFEKLLILDLTRLWPRKPNSNKKLVR